ncbi:Sec-independent protein translocase protein TatB [Massilia sp. PWRC2]|uniref:Sec-independent protein translocase protein TatB n=1 Tax=Massilia sp. PWRC2 TaxID=2804626 RepID=UPI003CF48595
MIDLGLSKIAIIGVVALIVIGPEKLPKVARMAGTLYGRAQRYLHDIKSEVSREIELEELRSLRKEVVDTAEAIRTEVQSTIHSSVDDVEAAWRGHPATFGNPTASVADLERKARDFRRKKLTRNSAIPGWYKQRNGGKMHLMSGAARVKKYRPRATTASTSSSFF